MARQLVECVPEFQRGGDAKRSSRLSSPFSGDEGCYSSIDFRPTRTNNRLVVSLAGEPAAICDAVLAASRTAVERIDLNVHREPIPHGRRGRDPLHPYRGPSPWRSASPSPAPSASVFTKTCTFPSTTKRRSGAPPDRPGLR